MVQETHSLLDCAGPCTTAWVRGKRLLSVVEGNVGHNDYHFSQRDQLHLYLLTLVLAGRIFLLDTLDMEKGVFMRWDYDNFSQAMREEK